MAAPVISEPGRRRLFREWNRRQRTNRLVFAAAAIDDNHFIAGFFPSQGFKTCSTIRSRTCWLSDCAQLANVVSASAAPSRQAILFLYMDNSQKILSHGPA